jgi:quercetin dioxygenase-like cupin family protein
MTSIVRKQLGRMFVLFTVAVNLAGAQTVEKRTLTLQGAEAVIAAAKAEAQKLQAPGGVIAVVDDGGNLMALERLDGTFSAGANISIGKARTAVMFKKPTRFFEELINSSGKGRTVMTALENLSGAASADQDEKLALAGAAAFETPKNAGNDTPVSFFEKSKVEEAFSKGAVLLDGSDGRNYMVHASRREKPGQAEIHTKDTDVIYVLNGTATFVTGGEAVNAKTTAPDELRGDSIRSGQTRQIAKGDVIVVPNGVPHQFLEVTNPFLYYVVKVR